MHYSSVGQQEETPVVKLKSVSRTIIAIRYVDPHR